MAIKTTPVMLFKDIVEGTIERFGSLPFLGVAMAAFRRATAHDQGFVSGVVAKSALNTPMTGVRKGYSRFSLMCSNRRFHNNDFRDFSPSLFILRKL